MLRFVTHKENGQKFVHEYEDVNNFIYDDNITEEEEDESVSEASIDGESIDLYEEAIYTVDDLLTHCYYVCLLLSMIGGI